MKDTLFTPLWAYKNLSGSVNLFSAQSSQKKVCFLIVGWFVDNQFPANGVPNNPTPSSAQIRMNIITLIVINIFLYL